MTFAGRRKPMGILPKAADIPWIQLIGEGGPSTSQFIRDEAGNVSPRMIPRKRAWRPAGWPALHLAYVHSVGQADAEASRIATRAPWSRRA